MYALHKRSTVQRTPVNWSLDTSLFRVVESPHNSVLNQNVCSQLRSCLAVLSHNQLIVEPLLHSAVDYKSTHSTISYSAHIYIHYYFVTFEYNCSNHYIYAFLECSNRRIANKNNMHVQLLTATYDQLATRYTYIYFLLNLLLF